MHPLRSIREMLTVPADEPELALAQIRSVARQIPILHAMLSLNAIAVGYTHYGFAPDWLTLLPVSLLVCFCTTRIVQWTTLRIERIDADEAVRRLRATNRFVAILGVGFSAWALALTDYGDAGQHMQ